MKKAQFISHYSADSFFNMAFDEWMFNRVLNVSDLLILRLYSWKIGTITFGYNQRTESAYNHNKIGSTPAIRRITGGRALFHDPSEITYSIAVNSSIVNSGMFGSTISSSSEIIAKILVRFLKNIGIESDYKRKSSSIEKDKSFFHKAPCFASNSKNEILKNNVKIIASAQRRFKDSIFQHGSIKVNGHANHPALPLQNYNINLDNEHNVLSEFKFNILKKKFLNSFSDELGLSFKELYLSNTEHKHIQFITECVERNCLEKRDLFKTQEDKILY